MKPVKLKYCEDLNRRVRRPARIVSIGDVPLGGHYPIRIQSMTTTNTMDTKSTVEQSIRMIEAGCEYVRITTPSIREAENLSEIRKVLNDRGYRVPLIADIHFTPNAAEVAARMVEKVRINPGNYVDKKKFQAVEYSDSDYQAELDRIFKRFSPLVKICKEYGTAMRIGTNHGSLSDRIMSRYGDTPLGMVESALEFIRICEYHGYHDMVLSMKSSNPFIMVEAYRLLAHRMYEENMNYPFHLGVTEAGSGEDGRIKSAIGIGALLEDGLGDTIRVSLTEEPEKEIPVALQIVERYNILKDTQPETPVVQSPVDPFVYSRRETIPVMNVGGGQVPVVVGETKTLPANECKLGYSFNKKSESRDPQDIRADLIYIHEPIHSLPDSGKEGPAFIIDEQQWQKREKTNKIYPVISWEVFLQQGIPSRHPVFLRATTGEIQREKLKELTNVVLVLRPDGDDLFHRIRRTVFSLMEKDIPLPVIVEGEYSQIPGENRLISAAIELGGLMIDGLVDGIWLNPSDESMLNIVFGILQSTRMRISRTEYISCPSCGRTLFDLQETSRKIREKTEHLKGLKIGIMGCIVNGPGEMADADYGYVGTGTGVISLYRSREVVKRNIPEEQAVDELIRLIKGDGRWSEPSGKSS